MPKEMTLKDAIRATFRHYGYKPDDINQLLVNDFHAGLILPMNAKVAEGNRLLAKQHKALIQAEEHLAKANKEIARLASKI